MCPKCEINECEPNKIQCNFCGDDDFSISDEEIWIPDWFLTFNCARCSCEVPDGNFCDECNVFNNPIREVDDYVEDWREYDDYQFWLIETGKIPIPKCDH
jgi:hypothetical protein